MGCGPRGLGRNWQSVRAASLPAAGMGSRNAENDRDLVRWSLLLVAVLLLVLLGRRTDLIFNNKAKRGWCSGQHVGSSNGTSNTRGVRCRAGALCHLTVKVPR